MKQKLFKAHRYSGIESSPFITSVIVDFVAASNVRHKYQFPFYAVSVDIATEFSDEWVRDDLYAHVCDRIVADCLQSGLAYFEQTAEQSTEAMGSMDTHVRSVWPTLMQMTDAELMSSYIETMNFYTSQMSIGAVTFLYEAILSKRLQDSLCSHYEEGSQIVQHEIHTDYISFMTTHEQAVYALAALPVGTEREQGIQEYINNWYYIDANYNRAPLLTPERVEEKIQKWTQKHASAAQKLGTDTEAALPNYTLTKEEEVLVELFRITTVIRDTRKQVNLMGSFIMERFLEEVARRRNIDMQIARRAHWRELSQLLYTPNECIPTLQKRAHMSFVLDEEGGSHYLPYQAIEEIQERAEAELRGTPVSHGIAEGVVRVVRTSAAFNSFETGNVLVTEMTRPEFVPIMKKAAAIVTDEGGLTSHAAIVSRELGIPCILGTRNATQVLKNGDRIRVDAIKGVIIKLSDN